VHSNQLIIFICCRTWIAHVLHANENREKGRRSPRIRECCCWADAGSQWRRWLGSSVAVAAMLLLFLCKDISPCIFSFSFFSVFTLGSLLSIPVLLLSSLSISLFFSFSPLFSFLSFRSPLAASLSSLFVFSLLFSFGLQTPLLFCLPSSALFPCIYRKKHGRER